MSYFAYHQRRAQNSLVALFLFALGPRERAHIDFQSSSGNAVSIGLACNLTRDLQLSPSRYITDDTPHHVLGYVLVPLHLSHLAAEDERPLNKQLRQRITPRCHLLHIATASAHVFFALFQ